MEKHNPDSSDFDPLAMWKQFQEPWFKNWSKAMTETVNSETFAEAMGKYLDSYLSTSSPMQYQLEKSMDECLSRLNVPTRDDVLSLAERLTHVEMQIDDLDAKVDELLDQLKALYALLSATDPAAGEQD